jgi:hypothetical protein
MNENTKKILFFVETREFGFTNDVTTYNTMNLVLTTSGINEHSVITSKFLGQIDHFSRQINPIIANPFYNEQKWLVPSSSLQPSLTVYIFCYSKLLSI